MHQHTIGVGRTIRGFIYLASANLFSVLEFNESTLWTWLDKLVRSLGVVSSLGGLGKKLREVDMKGGRNPGTVSVLFFFNWLTTYSEKESRNGDIAVLLRNWFLTASLYQMAHSSNLIIGSTFNSAQGDFHIHNRDSESGMHDFRFVQKSMLIDDPMNLKDFISWD